jgi:ERCC4-related helicase
MKQWIDPTTISTWQYPVNFPLRDYQYNIVQECLFKNTLVSIPTGLGKTFISGVVMMNFLRWFPFGKVCFLAPTRPLVAQQMAACKSIGINEGLMVELTGSTAPFQRQALWKGKRVFFLTPQIMQNDISKGICPCEFITCLIIDESHRARGRHSYCEVVKDLWAKNSNFRIVALSATPASTSAAVQDVVDALFIEHVEIRTEESLDIRPYIHKKQIDSIVVELSPQIQQVKELFERCILSHFICRLVQAKVLYESNAEKIGKAMLLKLREAYRMRVSKGNPMIEADFAALISFVHSYELLINHGLISFYSNIYWLLTDKSSKFKGFLARDPQILQMINHLHLQFSITNPESIIQSHPKMPILEKNLLEFFTASNFASRVIIFTEFRETVGQIVCLLSIHYPTVKVASFMGKADCKSGKGIKQKDQMEIVEQFRNGQINVLVSTSIGEEGLDIGEVDLIICYDSQTSPIRTLQRMGRTGRKRNGNIILLLTKGKEESKWKQTNANYKSIQNAVSNKSLKLFKNGTRMIPDAVNPQCEKIVVSGLSLDEFSFDIEEEAPGDKGEEGESLCTPLFELCSDGNQVENEFEDDLDYEFQQIEFPSGSSKEEFKKGEKENVYNQKEIASEQTTIQQDFKNIQLSEKEILPQKTKDPTFTFRLNHYSPLESDFSKDELFDEFSLPDSLLLEIPIAEQSVQQKDPDSRPSVESVVLELFDDVFVEGPIQSQDFDSSILSCLDSAFSDFNGKNEHLEKLKNEEKFQLKTNQNIQRQKKLEIQERFQLKINQNIESQKESNTHSTFSEKESNTHSTLSEKESNIYSIDSQEIFSDCNSLIQNLKTESQSANPFLATESVTPSLIPGDLFDDENWEMDLNEASRPPKESPILVKRPLIGRNLIISSPLSSKPSPIAVSAPKRAAPIGNFLDIEAEESQPFEGSELEEHTSDYEEMSSFIADEESSQDVDMNFYRKSLVISQIPEFEGRKNLFEREGRFKLRL